MTTPKDPQLIDLARYKKAIQDKARAEARGRQAQKGARHRTAPGGKEPLLGSRPGAGLILVAAALIAAALWLAPRWS